MSIHCCNDLDNAINNGFVEEDINGFSILGIEIDRIDSNEKDRESTYIYFCPFCGGEL